MNVSSATFPELLYFYRFLKKSWKKVAEKITSAIWIANDNCFVCMEIVVTQCDPTEGVQWQILIKTCLVISSSISSNPDHIELFEDSDLFTSLLWRTRVKLTQFVVRLGNVLIEPNVHEFLRRCFAFKTKHLCLSFRLCYINGWKKEGPIVVPLVVVWIELFLSGIIFFCAPFSNSYVSEALQGSAHPRVFVHNVL